MRRPRIAPLTDLSEKGRDVIPPFRVRAARFPSDFQTSYGLNLKNACGLLPSLSHSVMVWHWFAYAFGVFQLNCQYPSPRYCSPEAPVYPRSMSPTLSMCHSHSASTSL